MSDEVRVPPSDDGRLWTWVVNKRCAFDGRAITPGSDPDGFILIRARVAGNGYDNVPICTPCWIELEGERVPHRMRWTLYDAEDAEEHTR